MQRIRVEPAPAIRLGGRRVGSEILYGAFGAHVLLLSTTIADVGFQFHATYVGHERTDAQVAELLIAPGALTASTRTVERGELPVTYARERCLYDHLYALHDALRALGYDPVEIDVDEPALAVLSR